MQTAIKHTKITFHHKTKYVYSLLLHYLVVVIHNQLKQSWFKYHYYINLQIKSKLRYISM